MRDLPKSCIFSVRNRSDRKMNKLVRHSVSSDLVGDSVPLVTAAGLARSLKGGDLV